MVLFHYILSWYASEDFVEDIKVSLEMLGLNESDLSLTLSQLSGDCPFRISILVLLSWYTVGNTEFWVGIIFVEEKVNLFLISLIDTTLQDGGSRERKDI